MPNGLALCALHHRLLDHGAHHGVRGPAGVGGAVGSSARVLEKLDGQEIRLPVDPGRYPKPLHLHLHRHQREVFKGRV